MEPGQRNPEILALKGARRVRTEGLLSVSVGPGVGPLSTRIVDATHHYYATGAQYHGKACSSNVRASFDPRHFAMPRSKVTLKITPLHEAPGDSPLAGYRTCTRLQKVPDLLHSRNRVPLGDCRKNATSHSCVGARKQPQLHRRILYGPPETTAPDA